MKISIIILMLFFATCSETKKGATGDTSENAGQDKVGHMRDGDAQKQDSSRLTLQNSNNVQASKKSMQDSVYGLTFIAGDAYSGTETAETLVITDAKRLQKFYSRINRTRKPGLPVPDLDFSKQMVIVRCSGVTDYSVPPELYVMEVKVDSVILGIREIEKSATTSAVTTPFAVYKMSSTEKEISIRE